MVRWFVVVKCPECQSAQLHGRGRCPRHSTCHAKKVQRHRDRKLWIELQREGYTIEELEQDFDELKPQPRGWWWDLPAYLRDEMDDLRSENLTAADLPPKRHILKRLIDLHRSPGESGSESGESEQIQLTGKWWRRATPPKGWSLPTSE